MTCKEYFKSLPVEEQLMAYKLEEFSIKLEHVKGIARVSFHSDFAKDERFPNIHELKILPEFYEAVIGFLKRFELRKDDRDYQVDDFLILEEWDGQKYTGRFAQRRIRYILRRCPEYGVKDGYCILGF